MIPLLIPIVATGTKVLSAVGVPIVLHSSGAAIATGAAGFVAGTMGAATAAAGAVGSAMGAVTVAGAVKVAVIIALL